VPLPQAVLFGAVFERIEKSDARARAIALAAGEILDRADSIRDDLARETLAQRAHRGREDMSDLVRAFVSQGEKDD